MDGSCKIAISGVYRITFKIYIYYTETSPILLGIKVNGNIINNVFTSELLHFTGTNQSQTTPIENNIILSLNAGDIISIVNSLSQNISIYPYNFVFIFDNNISIEKID